MRMDISYWGLAGMAAVWIIIFIASPSCSKQSSPEGPYGSWIDTVDGTVYRTIMIGDQIWLADNIDKGVMIEGGSGQQDNGIIEKYCYDDNPVLCEKYGGLYQWGEAMQYSTSESSRGICPAGWHIPSDSEWKILEIYLGMSGVAADDILWRGEDQGLAIQSGGDSGFGALRGGNRFLKGEFSQIGNAGYFWTSTGHEDRHAWRRGVSLDNGGIYRSINDVSFGFSVRCVRY